MKPYWFRITLGALALGAALAIGGARSLPQAVQGSKVLDLSSTPSPRTGFDPIIGMNPKAYQETIITVHLDPGQSPEIVAGEEYRIDLVLSSSWSPGSVTFTEVAGYGNKYGVVSTPTDAQNATATATYYRNVDGDWKQVDVRATRFQVAESL